jgi:Uma2 family endonuclease
LEVADSSLSFDLGDKASLYAASGIEDYWVLDVVNRRLHILRDPRPDSNQRFGFGYSQQRSFWPADRVSPLALPQSTMVVSNLLP